MRNVLAIVVTMVLVAYLVARITTVSIARANLANRVQYRLDFVDEASFDSVKQDLIHDARDNGIDLAPDDIHIVYEDTGQLSVPQQLVGDRLHLRFVNKQVGISVHYTANILGFRFGQDITRTKIKQVEAHLPDTPVPAGAGVPAEGD